MGTRIHQQPGGAPGQTGNQNWSGAAAGGGDVWNSIHRVPDQPGTIDDDEFSGTTIDTTKYRAWRWDTKAPVTPEIGCKPFGNDAFRWALGERPSCLSMESRFGIDMEITRKLDRPMLCGPGSPRWCVYTRTLRQLLTPTAANPNCWPGGQLSFHAFADNAGDPDWENRMQIVLYPYAGSGGFQPAIYVARVVAGVGTTLYSHEIDGNASGSGAASYGMRSDVEKCGFIWAAGTFRGIWGNEYTEINWPNSPSDTAWSLDIGHIGWSYVRNVGNDIPHQLCQIDYLRFRLQEAGDTTGATPVVP